MAVGYPLVDHQRPQVAAAFIPASNMPHRASFNATKRASVAIFIVQLESEGTGAKATPEIKLSSFEKARVTKGLNRFTQKIFDFKEDFLKREI